MINELTTAMSSAEDFSDAFSRLFDEEMNIMDPASATTSAVLAPEAVPFRQNPTLARLSAIRQDTRSLDYSRERRRVPRPQLLPLRPVSRNRNIRRIAFARVMSRLAHRLSQPHVTSNAAKRTDLPNPSDPSGIQRTMQRGRDTTGGPLMLRRVRSAGPVLGRERKIEMEVTSLPPVSQSQTTGPQDVATSRETMHEELLDTSILITCNDGRLFHVYDYNTLKAAR
ncbi:hypothetical protein QFC19_004174 [Naganishia cerealis]|uniref:Uncharacterized protein n=1 Tax=Naganishia cerealis TaxID=610337 RepID=A0ACC2VYU8_9TREE|nr:hypothetical protein QFC19_004174 [Naganishia cerealis]